MACALFNEKRLQSVSSADLASSCLEYLTKNGLLYSKQSAYRPGHSCETALLSLTDNWLKAIDDSKLVGSVFLDLSKAFDLVSHDILLSKIAKYHASQPTLRWFRSYLCDRTQTCAISGVLSDPLTLTQGEPQGSILGPVLFSLYINDLPLCLPVSDVEIYADDTTLWTSDHSFDNFQHNLQNSLNNASRCFTSNQMVPVDKTTTSQKTKQLLIATRQKLQHVNQLTLDLYLNGNRVKEAEDEKLLGVRIDHCLTWHSHIDYLIGKLNSRTYLLKRAKGYTSISTAEKFSMHS